MSMPSNALGLVVEPKSGDPTLYGKAPNSTLEQDGLDAYNN